MLIKYLYICVSLKKLFLMDELTLLLEGIQHKVKRLRIVNNGLKEKIDSLTQERLTLLEEIEAQKQHSEQMKDEILYLQAVKSLGGKDSKKAMQKVNELLREIDKCYELINNQAK